MSEGWNWLHVFTLELVNLKLKQTINHNLLYPQFHSL